MITSFDQLPWHDATMLDILVDRRPGENDRVLVSMEWPDGSHDQVKFVGCWACQTTMYFGSAHPETVLTASVINDNDFLTEFRNRWEKYGPELPPIRCFEMTMGHSDYSLRVYAEGFRVVPSSKQQ